MTKKDTSIAKTESSALEIANLVSDVEVTGFESMSSKDMEIPFLTILESGSPQCKKSNDAYLEGATEGMIMNTFSNELFDGAEGVVIVPCYFEKSILEWKPERGGLAGIHTVNTPLMANTVKDEKGRSVLGNGNALVETAQYYVLHLKPNGEVDKVCISMASTRLKCSRRWNRVMGLKKITNSQNGGQSVAPMFCNKYTLSLEGKQDGSDSWWVWKEDSGQELLDIEVFKTAMALAAECHKGLVKVAVNESDDIPF